MRSSRSAGVAVADVAGDRRTWAIAAATGCSASPSGGSANRLQRPPAGAPVVAARRRCSRTAACAGWRRAPASSVGSAAARSASSRSRISGARYTTDAFSARYGTARRGERRLEHRQRRARRQQHGDVARPARAQPAVAVADRPALAQRGGDGGGDRRGLALAQLLGVDVVAVVVVGAEHVDRAVVARLRPAGVERAVRRLHAGLGLDDVAEHAVDPVDDGRRGAEVGRQHLARRRRSGRRRRGRRRCRRGGTGRSTASGRRRRTAGRGAGAEPPGRPAGRPGRRSAARRSRAGSGRCPGTRRAGPAGSAGAGAGGRRSSGGQQAPGEHEQVVELERAGGGPLACAVEHEAPGDRADDEPAVLAPRAAGARRRARARATSSARSASSASRAAVVAPVGLVADAAGAARVRFLIVVEAGEHRAEVAVVDDARPPRPASSASSAGLAVVGRAPAWRASSATRAEHRLAPGRPRRRRQVDAVLDEVPVGLEVLDDAAQAAGAAERRPRAQLDELGGRSPGATSRSASSSSSSRRSSQRSSSASWLSSSSSTLNPGGRPASTGNSNRMRRAKACSVPIGAWSRASRAALARRRRATRRGARAGGGAARRRPSR